MASDNIHLKNIKRIEEGDASGNYSSEKQRNSVVDSSYGSVDILIGQDNLKGQDNPAYDEENRTGGKADLYVEQPTGFEDEEVLTGCAGRVNAIQDRLSSLYKNNQRPIWILIWLVIACLYFAYFGYAMYHSFGDEGSIRLLVVTILGVVFFVTKKLLELFGDRITCACSDSPGCEKLSHWFMIVMIVVLTLFMVIYIVVDVVINKTPENLISAGGMLFFILVFYLFSYNPARVKWRPVFFGLALQFIFALLILRWNVGYQAFKWLGDRVSEFLSYSDEGAKFVFGADFAHHFFAFKVLPVIVFFSTAISVLYYMGVMQFIIRNIAKFIAMALGTSPTESLNAAGNIFIGQSEAPLMIRPFLENMTNSELHAVCTGGFATIAGSVMAAYILYDVPANHLLSASVMSAPAALAMSKLFYPETETSHMKANAAAVYQMAKGDERNVIEAASRGASNAISLIANIAVNLIAFIALLGFVNATLSWMGHRVGLTDPELTFQLICSYVFWPLPFLMGVHFEDCRKVAEMIGIKTFINEFVAYEQLSVYIKNQVNMTAYDTAFNITSNGTLCSSEYCDFLPNGDIFLSHVNQTLLGGVLADRSVVISTYALCGFSNFSSIGIMLGALGAMVPSRRSDLSQLILRAMIAGNVACFMTACIAGLLYRGEF